MVQFFILVVIADGQNNLFAYLRFMCYTISMTYITLPPSIRIKWLKKIVWYELRKPGLFVNSGKPVYMLTGKPIDGTECKECICKYRVFHWPLTITTYRHTQPLLCVLAGGNVVHAGWVICLRWRKWRILKEWHLPYKWWTWKVLTYSKKLFWYGKYKHN